jgi:hypothetical protein
MVLMWKLEFADRVALDPSAKVMVTEELVVLTTSPTVRT